MASTSSRLKGWMARCSGSGRGTLDSTVAGGYGGGGEGFEVVADVIAGDGAEGGIALEEVGEVAEDAEVGSDGALC